MHIMAKDTLPAAFKGCSEELCPQKMLVGTGVIVCRGALSLQSCGGAEVGASHLYPLEGSLKLSTPAI